MSKFFGGIAAMWAALWSTAKELADSKKAVVSFLGIAVTVGSQFFPQYQAQFDKILPIVDAFFLLLVAAIGLVDAFQKKPADDKAKVATVNALADVAASVSPSDPAHLIAVTALANSLPNAGAGAG